MKENVKSNGDDSNKGGNDAEGGADGGTEGGKERRYLAFVTVIVTPADYLYGDCSGDGFVLIVVVVW